MKQAVTVTTLIEAPVKTAWDAFTQPEQIVKWNHASDDWHCPSATNDLRVGGKFGYVMAARDDSVSFEFGGEYTDVQPLQRIEYTLGDGRTVRVEFQASRDHQTRVTETFELEPTHTEEQQRAGWQAILENYRKHAESLVEP